MVVADWLSGALYSIFNFINAGIYGLVSIIMQGLFNLAQTTLFPDGITEFTQRIYVVLGIFMLFKLAFSLLTSIVNPDMLTDKEKGMQKIVPRTIIALIMLIMVPFLFQEAINLQTKIIPAIPRIILGTEASGDSMVGGGDTGTQYGEAIASSTFIAFVIPTEECNPNASTAEHPLAGLTVKEIRERNTETCKVGSTKYHAYDYNGLVAAAVGIFLAIILLFYCIDVAVRLIKLSILQLLAPIPIISYIDPKSSKDGAFANWSKQCISTYIDLFVKLAVVYFVIFLIAEMATGTHNLWGFPDGISLGAKLYVQVFIIIGAFFFMRQAPKFISEMLGVKGGGGLGMGIAGVIAGGAAIVGGAGVAGAGVAAISAIDQGAEASAQGKAAPSSWRTGRDLAAQMKTGNEKADGSFINTMRNKLYDQRADSKYNWSEAKGDKKDWEDAYIRSQSDLRDANAEYIQTENNARPVIEKFNNYSGEMKNELQSLRDNGIADADISRYAQQQYNLDYSTYRSDEQAYRNANDALNQTRVKKVEAENKHSYNEAGYKKAVEEFDKVKGAHRTPKNMETYNHQENRYRAAREPGNQGGGNNNP